MVNVGQLQAGVQAAADARMRNYARYQAQREHRRSNFAGNEEAKAPKSDENALMQTFMAGGSMGPSLSTAALTQVTQSLDPRLSQMETFYQGATGIHLAALIAPALHG